MKAIVSTPEESIPKSATASDSVPALSQIFKD
jgi:hypothetical protein